MNLQRIAISAALLCAPAFAQWLKIPTPGVPKGPDGKPNLTAPAPKMADGKPDLSGIWNADRRYLVNLAVDLKPGELSMQPWAEALVNERKDGARWKDEPDANCLPHAIPLGPPRIKRAYRKNLVRSLSYFSREILLDRKSHHEQHRPAEIFD